MYAAETLEQTFRALRSSPQGLGEEEVLRRLEQYGPNELPERKKSLFLLFLRQFHNILVYILFGALALSLVLPWYEHGGQAGPEDFLDAIAIGAILLLNAFLGFFQERKAERAIALLREMSAPMVRVRREGIVRVVPAKDVVPGDLLLLEEGDRVSADGRVVAARNAEVDEASLTGESRPVRKTTDVLARVGGIGDMLNMTFRGTVVTRGHLEACVTATGEDTELGKIAKLVTEVEHPPTPLEASMAKLSRWLGIIVSVCCVVILIVGVLRNHTLAEMLLAAASLAVSAVPEGLPAIVTVSLAIGVQRMIRRRVLTRELQAIETLGSVTVICTDKTGTITENDMEVQELWVAGTPVAVEWSAKNASVVFRTTAGGVGMSTDVSLLLEIGASCNNAHSLDVGDPTEIALLEVAHVARVLRRPIVEEDVPFTSEKKYMATMHDVTGGRRGYLKGAPETILALCTHMLREGREVPLADADRAAILVENGAMASRALRVLAMAYRDGVAAGGQPGIVFVGLVGMLDPPRDGVREAIAVAKRAGIRTVIITGDHALTARAIAGRVGVESAVLQGVDLDHLSPEQLGKAVQTVSLFARVSPEHKVRILEALQAQGEIVAMGGDGVNDAPALKRAHVGFAMGKQGTDVARETAQIVLTDDHYASVVEAIEEGRTIYDNIRKFVAFLLRANFDELAVIFGAILFGWPLPLLPIHLLLINLVTDGLPALALSVEKPEPNVMDRPPRDPRQHILHGESFTILFAAVLATIATFHAFFWGWKVDQSVELARTFSFTTAVTFELFLALTCRSRRSLFEIGFFSNPYLIGANAISFVILLLVLYTPLAPLFHAVPLTLEQWSIPLGWGIGVLVIFEGLKFWPAFTPVARQP